MQNRRGADEERQSVRADLRRFSNQRVLKSEIPHSTQALRFVHRPHPDSHDTFNHKYSHIRSKVKAFGGEVLDTLENLSGEKNRDLTMTRRPWK